MRFGQLLVPDEDDTPPARRSRRDWVVDGALFLLAIALGGAGLASSIHNGSHGALLVVDATAGAVLCVALWWRRRWPLGLALASLPLLAVSSSAGPAGLIILFTVAAYRRWQLAVVLAAMNVALLPVERAVQWQEGSAAVYYLTSPLGIAAIVVWGMFLRGRRQERRERIRRARAEEQLRIEQIRHAERARIAREMHDVLAHRISLLSLHAGALQFRPDAPPEEIARAAEVIRASARQALQDLRAVIGMLREGTNGEAPQPPQQTLAGLPGLLEESRAAGMLLHADIRVADPAAVPELVGRNALRIVQEALTNARKHAASAAVELHLEGAPGKGLTIEVRNRAAVLAAGTAEIPGSGTGLVGLAERAALSGGHLDHGLDENGDFRLHAWLPWPE